MALLESSALALSGLVLLVLLGLVLLYVGIQCLRITCGDCDLAVRKVGPVSESFFKGKVVWVLGASSGIGAAYAKRAAQAGAHVIISARRAAKLEKVRGESATPERLEVLPLDVTDKAACAAAVAKIVKTHGKLDVAVLNAGAGCDSLAEDTSADTTGRLFSLNVMSCVHLTTLLIPAMRASCKDGGRASLVVTSSVSGKLAAPFQSSYTASKHALNGYFDSVRFETAHFMDVTVIIPGPVDTAFGSSRLAGKDKAGAPKKWKKYLAPTRVADVMLRATQGGCREVWVAPQPFLWYLYMHRYIPDTFGFCQRKKNRKVMAALRAKPRQVEDVPAKVGEVANPAAGDEVALSVAGA